MLAWLIIFKENFKSKYQTNVHFGKSKKNKNITNRPRKKVGVNKQFAQIIIFAQDNIIYNMLKMK